MARDVRLLFGPAAALIFTLGVIALPLFVPGYSAVRQTVSEIGEINSPMRWPFAALLGIVAACLLVFAIAIHRASRDASRNGTSAVLIAWMAIAAAALGWFAFPHPWHNFFGISELIAYQAPIAFVLAWRGAPGARGAVAFSIVMYVLLLVSIVLNLSSIARDNALWETVRPFYGLVQRSLFECFFLWCGGLGWLLWVRAAKTA